LESEILGNKITLGSATLHLFIIANLILTQSINYQYFTIYFTRHFSSKKMGNWTVSIL